MQPLCPGVTTQQRAMWDTVAGWGLLVHWGRRRKKKKALQPSLLSQAAEGVVPRGPSDAAAAAAGALALAWGGAGTERVLFAIRPVGTAPPWCKPSDVNRFTCPLRFCKR